MYVPFTCMQGRGVPEQFVGNRRPCRRRLLSIRPTARPQLGNQSTVVAAILQRQMPTQSLTMLLPVSAHAQHTTRAYLSQTRVAASKGGGCSLSAATINIATSVHCQSGG